MLKKDLPKSLFLPPTLTVDLNQIPTDSPISEKDIQTILHRFRQKNFVHYMLVKFLLLTGVTFSELTNLKLDDFKMDQGKCTIRSGERLRSRSIFIDEAFSNELQRYVHKYDRNIYLFPGREGQTSIRCVQKILSSSERWVSKRIHGIQIRDFVAHHFYKRGFPISEIQEFLGHRSLQSTRERIQLHLQSHEMENWQFFSPRENDAA